MIPTLPTISLSGQLQVVRTATWDKARKKAAIDWVAQKWIAPIEDRITPQAGIEWLKGVCAKLLHGGLLDELKVIEAAEGGDHVAHETLVKAYWEARRVKKEPSPFVESYVGRADLNKRPAPRRKRGRHVRHQNLPRNIQLAILVALTCKHYGLNPTRETRGERWPSGCSIVARAARERGITIRESTLANLWASYGSGLAEAGGHHMAAGPSWGYPTGVDEKPSPARALSEGSAYPVIRGISGYGELLA